MSDPDALGGPVATEAVFAGRVLSVRVSCYRRPSGLVVRREVIDHPGAVAVVPVHAGEVIMVRQPREAIGRHTLEIPAGKRDVPGEPPEDCARRELEEEIGRRAGRLEELGDILTSPAISTERIRCYLATALEEVPWRPEPEEEIEIVPWPLARLDALIAQVVDAKTLVGLLRLARRLDRGDVIG